MTALPTISIIICTYNRAEDLRQTLEAIGHLPIPEGCRCDLTVVDNASSDATAEVVKQCCPSNMPVRYIHEPRQGQCYARNTGMAATQGEIILFTDDDVRPPGDWLEGMCRPIASGAADAVAGGVKLAPHLHPPWMKQEHARWVASTEYIPKEAVINLVGANMAFSRRVLERVPQFDVALGPGARGLGDETLFSQQLEKAGYRFAMALDIVAEHHLQPERLTRKSYAALARKRGNSNAYISWHWSHDGPRLAYLALVRSWAALWARRLLYFPEWATSPTVPAWELQLLDTLYTKLYYLQERKRPRNYEKFGLVKLR